MINYRVSESKQPFLIYFVYIKINLNDININCFFLEIILGQKSY